MKLYIILNKNYIWSIVVDVINMYLYSIKKQPICKIFHSVFRAMA